MGWEEAKRNPLVSSALPFTGGVHIGAIALLDPKDIWFDYVTCLSQWLEGGNLLVQMISTCFQGA
jgi:hypothetical protein